MLTVRIFYCSAAGACVTWVSSLASPCPLFWPLIMICILRGFRICANAWQVGFLNMCMCLKSLTFLGLVWQWNSPVYRERPLAAAPHLWLERGRVLSNPCLSRFDTFSRARNARFCAHVRSRIFFSYSLTLGASRSAAGLMYLFVKIAAGLIYLFVMACIVASTQSRRRNSTLSRWCSLSTQRIVSAPRSACFILLQDMAWR